MRLIFIGFYLFSFLGLRPKPALLFSLQKRPCGPHLAGRTLRAAFAKSQHPERLLLGLHPKPSLLFLIAEKEGKKASTPGSHKIYFYPGILQLPTVGQVKYLYTPLKINFIDGFKGGRLTTTTRQRQKQATTTKARRETAPYFMPCRAVQERVFVA